MKHVILVRHGESQINLLNRTVRVYCGQYETPLTDAGRQQARDAGRWLAARTDLRIEAAVSSELGRARETLDLLLGELGVPLRRLPVVAGLNERSLGAFEGRTEQDVFEEFPEYRDHPRLSRFQSDFIVKAPGGENLAEVTERAWLTLQSLVASVSGDLLVVSHYNTIRCLLGRMLHLSRAEVLELSIPNAEPRVVPFDP